MLFLSGKLPEASGARSRHWTLTEAGKQSPAVDAATKLKTPAAGQLVASVRHAETAPVSEGLVDLLLTGEYVQDCDKNTGFRWWEKGFHLPPHGSLWEKS